MEVLLYSVQSAENGAKIIKKSGSISEMDFIRPIQLLRKNYSQAFFNAQMSKLKAGIDMYKDKIQSHQKEREKSSKKLALLQKVSPDCQKIKCPLEEKPVCAKFTYENGKRRPFYVTLINQCEMQYMKCHQGLEATIVPGSNCHSILDEFPYEQFEIPTTPGFKRRAKREVVQDPSITELNAKENTATEIMKINKDSEASTLKPTSPITITKASNSKKDENKKSLSSKRITNKGNGKNSRTQKPRGPHNREKSLPNAFHKKLDLKAYNKISIKDNKRNPKILNTHSRQNKKKVNTQTKIQKVLSKNPNSELDVHEKTYEKNTKQKLRVNGNVNSKTKRNVSQILSSKNGQTTLNEAVVISGINKTATKITQALESPVSMQQKSKNNISKTAYAMKIVGREGESISRNGKEYLTKNKDKKNKMFTHDVFGDNKAKKLNDEFKETNDVDGPAIQGTIEIDEDDIQNDANSPQNGFQTTLKNNHYNEENMELTIEMDDADVIKMMQAKTSDPDQPSVPTEEKNEPQIEGEVEFDDDNVLLYDNLQTGDKPDNEEDQLAGIFEIDDEDLNYDEPVTYAYNKTTTSYNRHTNQYQPQYNDDDNMYNETDTAYDYNGDDLNPDEEEAIEGDIEYDDNENNGNDYNGNDLNPNEEEEAIEGDIEVDDNENNGNDYNGGDFNQNEEEEAIEGAVEFDDNENNGNDYNGGDFNQNEGEEAIEGAVEFDDNEHENNAEENVVNEVETNDNGNDNFNGDDQALADELNDGLPYDPQNPLVDEPDIGDSDQNLNDNESGDYVYVPGSGQIVALSNEDISKDENDFKFSEDPSLKDDDDSDDKIVTPELVNEKNNVEYGDDEVDKTAMNAECPQQCPGRYTMVCAMCNHGIYRTFLSVCHMRMYSCRGVHRGEQLELISHYPCVMSAPIITEDPPMQPKGYLSLPGDRDRVLLYVRCRERGLIGKNPKCKFEDKSWLNQEVYVTEKAPMEY